MEHLTKSSLEKASTARSSRLRRPARVDAGFTIVELIIVLCILMTVSAIAIPNLMSGISVARDARATVEVRDISEMVLGYVASNNGNYPNSLADVECDKLKDPWGNPYQYLNLTVPANVSLARVNGGFNVPINTTFDLYSMGPDGVSTPPLNAPQSQDDIVYANNGSYIGLALQY